jgi:hypothetical protein
MPLTFPPPPPAAAPPPPPHPAQHAPSPRRAIPHSALPFNQLSHPPHRPLPLPHHLRTTLQLFLHPPQLFLMQLPWSSQPPRLQPPHSASPNLLCPLIHRLPPHPQPPRHLRLPHTLPEQSRPLHPPPLQPRKVSPSRPHPAHGLILSESLEFVSYLSIKAPKSLTNKDLITKSLFLKDPRKNAR